MRVLITGAFGYFGVHLVRHLARSCEVVALGRSPRSICAAAVRAAIPTNVKALEADVGSPELKFAARQVDAVVHLAGGAVDTGFDDAVRDNVESASRVTEEARGKRLIFASSMYVYGPSERAAREQDGVAPDTTYGHLKAVAEAIWRRRGGIALRFSHIYGGLDIDFERKGVVERLARAKAAGCSFTVYGDGAQFVDLCHVDDACEVVERALTCSVSLPVALNVGGGAPIRVIDLVKRFGVEPVFAPAPQGESPPVSRVLDLVLVRETLGWEPRRTRDRAVVREAFT